MAVPFRRVSKTKKRMRRTHLKKDAPTTLSCPKCSAPIKPHRVCTKCGYYKGKEVIKVNSTEEKVEPKDVKKVEKKAKKEEK